MSLLLLWLTLAHAEGPLPYEAAGVGLDDPPGVPLPDVPVVDATGRARRLTAWLGAPFVVTLADLDCPKLCGVTTDGLARAAAGLDAPVVVVGLDPDDPPTAARDVAARLTTARGAPVEVLRADAVGVGRLARALGVRLRRLDDGTFAHPAASFVIDAEGRVATTVLEVRPDPAALREAVLEADAAPAPTLGAFVLACFRSVPSGRAAAAVLALRAFAGACVVGMPVLIAVLVRRRRA